MTNTDCHDKMVYAGRHNAPIGDFCDSLARMALRDEDLLTVAEVAGILHVNIRTVQRWIADGKLKAVRMPSGRYRVRAADADAMLRET